MDINITKRLCEGEKQIEFKVRPYDFVWAKSAQAKISYNQLKSD